ncbi:MAG TPA: DUF4160 domain-containing protein [Candidatus Paceibacterota bacterium]
MPTISRFYGIVIQMYLTEHDQHVPHFHALYGEYAASVDIATLRILAGSLPKRAARLVITWARGHRAELLADWERARQGETLAQVEPLE